MKTPPSREIEDFFSRMPRWAVVLIPVLLFGRFGVALIFYLLSSA